VTRQDVEARWRELDERELTPAEFDRQVQRALSDDEEIQQRAALVAWFMRRYPTPRERLAYARRKYRQLVESPLQVTVDGDPRRGG
jgi:hypothetical protein